MLTDYSKSDKGLSKIECQAFCCRPGVPSSTSGG